MRSQVHNSHNFIILVAASLLVLLISWGTLFFLYAPMWAGMYILVLDRIDKRNGQATLGILFRGFNYFGPFFILFLAILIIMILFEVFLALMYPADFSSFVAFLLSTLITTPLFFAPFLIIDSEMKLGSALQKSYEVIVTNFVPFALLWLITNALSTGFILFVDNVFSAFGLVVIVGTVFTQPIGFCIEAVAYRNIFGNSKNLELPTPLNRPKPNSYLHQL